ncbi:UDP-glucose--hexose-1-phosphate uridylyltransferase [Paenibacillus sp. 1P07SE]|uniref:UDP-glucose--hexose-1-phosphate uridylyltransferase n=1 Tax=Paenibacillus sp. 1P07SE TaxID=3132209 RepID=UPI0039A784B3
MNAASREISRSELQQVQQAIEELVQFGLKKRLFAPLDTVFTRNALLDLFGLNEPAGGEPPQAPDEPLGALDVLLAHGERIGLIPDGTTTWRDLLDARIMGLLLARPSATAAAFRRQAETEGIRAATDAFYQLNIDSNYIRMDRIRNNQYWQYASDSGQLEITINLSKPEKDPREIALLKSLPQSAYPLCLLCPENVGYAGRPDHPARQNLRTLPLQLNGEDWFFQYSPYVYYNEHCIVFRSEHLPMSISPVTFVRLLDFVEQYPHYFVGSNADLPIVGGSILSHDHFQGGRHTFPMETAPSEASYYHGDFDGVKVSIVRWPMSVARLNSTSKKTLLRAAEHMLEAWRSYSDSDADVEAYSVQDGERIPHNTITPIARLRDDGTYELDLVLRNNRTSEEHPDGIFHPHRELHHIKRENIGLIEVMGLAVLPGRLKSELEQLGAYLTGAATDSPISLRDDGHPLHHHAVWMEELCGKYGTALSAEAAAQALREETGEKFHQVLSDAGVFKTTSRGRAAFDRFLRGAGWLAE